MKATGAEAQSKTLNQREGSSKFASENDKPKEPVHANNEALQNNNKNDKPANPKVGIDKTAMIDQNVPYDESLERIDNEPSLNTENNLLYDVVIPQMEVNDDEDEIN